ncbi:hypothetical protein VTH06DRAFT_16 [Thermothelomyces fergusii]
MLFGRATAILSACTLLVLPCLSLPTNEQRQAGPQPLGPRATYSVVPIDGGSGHGGPGGSGGSGGSGSGLGPGNGGFVGDPVTVTVTKTLPQETSFRTVYVTPRPTTERVTETVVVTKTVKVVGINPAPTTLTTTTTNTTINTTINTTSSSSNTPTLSITETNSASSTPPVALPSHTPALPAPSSTNPPLQTGFTSTRASAGVTRAHGDGSWHTSHPFQNGTTWHRVSPDRRWLRRVV